ncbi:MAG: DUF2726 domain-containing protein [Burkholderiales bacterium]
MWWLLGGAVWIGVIAWLIISYQRKVGGRDRERTVQVEQMLAEVRAAKGTQGAQATAAAAPSGVSAPVAAARAAPVPAAQPPAGAAPWHGRERLLDQPRSLAYLLLRTGLPEHEIFANLTLADVVGVGAQWQGLEREQHLRRLAQTRADFVICTRRLQPVAVITLRETVADAAVVERLRFTEACLAAAAVRHVSFDAAALPRHGELRALVLGA